MDQGFETWRSLWKIQFVRQENWRKILTKFSSLIQVSENVYAIFFEKVFVNCMYQKKEISKLSEKDGRIAGTKRCLLYVDETCFEMFLRNKRWKVRWRVGNLASYPSLCKSKQSGKSERKVEIFCRFFFFKMQTGDNSKLCKKIENTRQFLFQCRKYGKRAVTINKSKLGLLNHKKKGTCLLTRLPLQYFGGVPYDRIERHTSIANLTLLCLLWNAFKHHPFWSTLFVPCNLHIEYSWPMYIFFSI